MSAAAAEGLPHGGHPPIVGTPLALLTIALAFATFMEVLDTSIANVAVPTIAGNLAVSASQGTWVISSYGLASAIAVPLTGWIAKRFGEVRVFIASILLFTVTSMLCGLAQSMPMLVAFRLMQGFFSGPMVPLSQTLLLSNYPPAKRGMAMAVWAMTVVVAPIFGPLLGGYITDNMSWPWIFYINVPVGLLAAWVTWNLLGHRETPTAKLPIDKVGIFLLVLGVGSLQVMLDNGNDYDWFNSSFIVTLAVVAAVALTFLIAWELTDEHPVVDLSLFKSVNFRAGVISLCLAYFAFFGSTVLLPLWLQTVLDYTPTWAGMATAPVGILALVFSPIVGKNLHRTDLRLVASFAFVVFAATSYWLSTFNLETEFSMLLWPRFLQGLGVACFFVPVNSIIVSGLPTSRLAAASGLSNFFRTLAGSFATAIVVTMWDRRAQMHEAVLSEHTVASGQATQDYIAQLGQHGISGSGAYAYMQQVMHSQAVQIATSEMFRGFGILFILLIAVLWFARPPFTAGGGGGH
ncbi:DHA2 family efflux MFS transporter permease subunit [Crenobacter sp. SG2303]|uniref:DHA2 family efflux MFS transporter permease subunit n=1 Tax=Crenobacter oryzisoli TaxID=3056844 RepID=A0ABT7XM79_9NEIS|nr:MULTISPECIES: DHA2 family efflux MFS transporter permease subunit [unclassified Crenobacter]MDN0074709.1 DHA2 family efflux MFS transporter permease subunit [Crenobacter sp. SG2303]MDN0083870.1 DHA2 family efflux MFS transporter permease subunit [Crenobacter sp. SG2305]